MRQKPEKTIIQRVTLLYWSALGLMAGMSSLIMSWQFTLGVLSGGVLAISNFNLMRRSIQNAFTAGAMDNPAKGKKTSLILTSFLRLGALGIIIYLLFATGMVDPIGIALGLSTVVIGILVFAIFMAIKPSSREAI